MEPLSEIIRHIKEKKDEYPQLSHASNIITKYDRRLNVRERGGIAKLIPAYWKYLKKMLSITGYDETSVRLKVSALNEYYNFMHDNSLETLFSAQGKFRPTILEEFLFLLFKDYVFSIRHQIGVDDVLDSGSVKAYTNLYFNAKNFHDFIKSPGIGVNEKDQDYAIYRSFNVSISDSDSVQIRVPAVAIEAKTYIDKTMLDSIIATAEKVKSGNPHARFVSVAERYDVSYSVDPSYSRIDQIYILRKGVRKKEWCDIDGDVVLKLYNDTLNHLSCQWADIEARVRDEGVVL